jgi:hypothetical protein
MGMYPNDIGYFLMAKAAAEKILELGDLVDDSEEFVNGELMPMIGTVTNHCCIN